MKPYINRAALSKSVYKSAGVSVLSYTVHALKTTGIYFGKIFDKGTLVNEFKVVCSDACQSKQCNLNLADFQAQSLAERGGKVLEVAKEGYLIFYDSTGDKNYQVRLEKAGSSKKRKIQFDTKKLNAGDAYAVSLLRPGKYEGRNLLNKSDFQVKVLYPDNKLSKKLNTVIPPVNVEVTEEGFLPNAIELTPGQGLVFNVKTPSSLEISLKQATERKNEPKPDLKRDKRTKQIRKRIRWNNPKKAL